MDREPAYYAIIPANVRYDKALTPNAKLLYAEITALANKNGYCWATNSYFAELYGVSIPSIKRWIKSLSDKNYIYTKVIRNKETKQVDKRMIYLSNTNDKNISDDTSRFKNERRGQYKNEPTPRFKNEPENNTSINTTSINNIYMSDSDESPSPSTTKEQELKDNFEKLWKLYPNKKGKKNAYTAYKSAIKNGATNKQIQDGIQAYRKQIELNGISAEYIKHGSTYFRQRAWEDDYSLETKEEGLYDNLGF